MKVSSSSDPLFGRKASLIVGSRGSPYGLALDLSEMHFKFETKQSDVDTPNTAVVRVFNLSAESVNFICSSDSGRFIKIQAGYVGSAPFGVIFEGDVIQTFAGRNGPDTYVDIFCADGDSINFATIETSIAAGVDQRKLIEHIFSRAVVDGKALGDVYPFAYDAKSLIGGINPDALCRGKMMYGMARDYVSDWALKNGFRWSIQKGELVLVPITGYRPGEAVVLGPGTGLVGVPEATNDGVHARCLLNPLIRIGSLVQINRHLISKTTIGQFDLGVLTTNNIPSAAITTTAGFYRVMVAEFSGDTRGQDWYTDLTCLAVDVTQPADESVKD